jgi:hypothetical protein
MNPSTYHLLAAATLAASALLAQGPGPAPLPPAVPAATLTVPTSIDKPPDAEGFISRWLILEPIPANGLTDNAVQAEVKKDYFPNQFTRGSQGWR